MAGGKNGVPTARSSRRALGLGTRLTVWLHALSGSGGIGSGRVVQAAFAGAAVATLLGVGGWLLLKPTRTYADFDGANLPAPTGERAQILSTVDMALPSGARRLILTKPYLTGLGNAGPNVLIAKAQHTQLQGGPGADVLVDDGGGDINFAFEPGCGRDVVEGFRISGPTHDHLSLKGFGFKDIADVRARLHQDGEDAILTLSEHDAVRLRNVDASDLTEDNLFLPINLTGYAQTFSDDFHTISLWNPLTNMGRWKTNFISGFQGDEGRAAWSSRTLTPNEEKEIYVDPAYVGEGKTPLGLSPFSVGPQGLTITAVRTPPALSKALHGFPFMSGLLTTQLSLRQTYGYFEIRALLPTAKGTWPAFWLLPTDGNWPPEIDVLEAVGGMKVYTTTHTRQFGALDTARAVAWLPDLDHEFHTYGVKWTPKIVAYYIDNQEIGSSPTPKDMHKPMYMLINLAMGGKWPGDPDADLKSARLRVAWVRAWRLPGDKPEVTP